MNFTKILKNLLDERNITQKELAKDIGISEVSISRYLNGDRQPRLDIVEDMAKYFNTSVDFLLGKSNDKLQIDTGYFKSIDEAVRYIVEDGTLFGAAGVDVNKLSDKEKVELANDIRNQVEMIGYKYRK